jgi:hypothetical protein
MLTERKNDLPILGLLHFWLLLSKNIGRFHLRLSLQGYHKQPEVWFNFIIAFLTEKTVIKCWHDMDQLQLAVNTENKVRLCVYSFVCVCVCVCFFDLWNQNMGLIFRAIWPMEVAFHSQSHPWLFQSCSLTVMTLGKQLFACFCALIEMEHLT